MNQSEWTSFTEKFAGNVCDIVSVDDNDAIGRLLRKHCQKRSLVVDAGCGIGSFLLNHAWRFKTAVGIEQVDEFLTTAKRRCRLHPHIRWVAGNVESASIDLLRSADLVVALNVVTTPIGVHRARLWHALVAMLRPKGLFLVATPSLESELHVHQTFLERDWPVAKATPSGIVLRGGSRQKFYQRGELIQRMEALGCQPIQVLKFHYPWRYEGIDGRIVRGADRPWDWLLIGVKKN